MKKAVVISYLTREGNIRHCKVNSEKAKELHTCPYREEIGGDYQTLCDCNEQDTEQCADDV